MKKNNLPPINHNNHKIDFSKNGHAQQKIIFQKPQHKVLLNQHQESPQRRQNFNLVNNDNDDTVPSKPNPLTPPTGNKAQVQFMQDMEKTPTKKIMVQKNQKEKIAKAKNIKQSQQQQPNASKKRRQFEKRNNLVWSSVAEQQLKQDKNFQHQKVKSLVNSYQELFLKDTTATYSNKNQVKHSFYFENYGEATLQEQLKDQLDLSNLLSAPKCKVTNKLRARMVDWMIEVFYNYKDTTSEFTFYRSIEILDYYIKQQTLHKNQAISDSDVHKIGITVIYIASKLEDIWHITLLDIFNKVCHKKFSMEEIKKEEWKIMTTIDFSISTPLPYEFLKIYLYKLFQGSEHQAVQNINETAQFIMKMTLYDDSLRNYKGHIVALAVAQLSVQSYFETLQETNQTEIPLKQLELGQELTNKRLEEYISDEEQCQRIQAIESISQLVENFGSKFKNLQNLQKYNF